MTDGGHGDDPREPGLLDRLVERAADALTALGFNGARLRWRWNQRRRHLEDARSQADQLLRSTRVDHKMCPECRALNPRRAKRCEECGESMSRVSTPGVGRLAANLFPGVSSAVSLILLVNGFWFVLMLMSQIRNGGGGGLFGFSDLEMMVRFGAGMNQPRQLADGTVTGGEWWRLVTPIFLHGGLLHFGFNSMFTLNVARIAENIYGTARFWVAYLAAGLAGTVCSEVVRNLLFGKFVVTVGASGALFGVMGMLIVYSLRHRSVLGDLKQTVGRFIFFMVVISVVFPIDHMNHAGGLLMGLLLGRIIPPPDSVRQAQVSAATARAHEGLWQILAILGVGLVLAAFAFVALSLGK